MYTSCQEKQAKIKAEFSKSLSEEDKYLKIIELGKSLPRLEAKYKTSENIVKGCQSVMYLRSYLKENVIVFEAESDALISTGLAAILLKVYSGESAEAILKCPPDYLEDLGIGASLTPNRANGLYSIHLRMKQDALKSLLGKSSKR
jgi:cysteine desulfuration protein SufE